MKPLVKRELFGVMHYVRDLDHASAWYCEKLGLELRGYGKNDFVELGLGGEYVMHLFKDEAAQPAQRASFAFDTPDIEAAHGMLHDRGVTVGPLARYSDHAAFTFRDCDGNPLMMCQYFANRDPV
ncbi:Glyoxalase-like domain-containing protein [Paenibacillus sp. UNC496MF]|uniref:VOC family protein n=1 Tax=Paenibacillus sp. UNC496MF TaxID=1502753 RepID=UPI0008F1FC60|nr:VOC family protein [Paenibacillus sp. UNC496MF]SFI75462.1 Glyoxalase-like domain-containing protein [Paenibacillus sp. UNC496MF]